MKKSMKKLVLAGLVLLASVMVLVGCDTNAGGTDNGGATWSPAAEINKITEAGTHTIVVPPGYTDTAAIRTALQELDKRNTADSSKIQIHLDLSKTGIKSIKERAFAGCKSLTAVSLPSTVTTIGLYAFQSCVGLTEVTIPATVINIGYGAFYNCGFLSSVKVEKDSVLKTIEQAAFGFCMNLQTIVIPASVTSIGKDAFQKCSSLKEINYRGTEEQWNEIDIDETNDKLINATKNYNYTE